MKTFLKIVGGLVAVVVLLVVGVLFWAGSKRDEILHQHIETHLVDFPIPFPLSEQEIAQLRVERTPRPAPDAVPPAPVPEGVAPTPAPDPLAGVDLKAIALERAIARGKHLVDSRFACKECHGANFGGGIMVDAPPIGHLYGVNITTGKGGQTEGFKPSDWDRIVRHGVLRDGRPAMMPSSDFFGMSDHELSDIVSYVRSVPPVDKEIARPTFGPVGTILVATGKLPISAIEKKEHKAAHPVEPPDTSVTVEFGKHMLQVCTGCHRENLAGGPITGGDPSWPPSLNLTPHAEGLAGWTFADFEKVLKSGQRRDGTPLRVPMKAMAAYAGNLTDTELKAMWLYLQSLPPTPTGK
jgi:mono/diheme cytochrome c family protein